jgi:hypothetical protein
MSNLFKGKALPMAKAIGVLTSTEEYKKKQAEKAMATAQTGAAEARKKYGRVRPAGQRGLMFASRLAGTRDEETQQSTLG